MESVSSLMSHSSELVAPSTLPANNIVSQDPEGTEFPWDSQCQKGREEGKRNSYAALLSAYGDKLEGVTDALNLLPFNGDAFSEMCEGQQRQQLREKVEVQWKRKAEAAAELKKRIIYECWVFKRGGGSFFSSTAYQKRYFVITDDQRLNYYEHYQQGGEPNGWVSCRGALVKARDGTETIEHKTCFTFTLQAQEGSCTSDILCACQTSAEREKLLATIENIEASIAEKKRESEEQGRSWEGCKVEIHSHSVASYNGRMALVKRAKDHRGLILVEFLSGSPAACPLTANVLPENLRRIPDGASQALKKTQEEMQLHDPNDVLPPPPSIPPHTPVEESTRETEIVPLTGV